MSDWVTAHFKDLSTPAIVEYLNLRHPRGRGWTYCGTAAIGHYGREGFPWEDVAPLP